MFVIATENVSIYGTLYKMNFTYENDSGDLTVIQLFFVILMAWFQTPAPTEPIEPLEVVIEATDGLDLHASFYAGQSGKTVLLLHQLYTTRQSWRTLTPYLLDNGYNVLIPDLRGYGKTRGNIQWYKAREDTLYWMEWLRQQPTVDPTKIEIIGSSMGANLAIIGCNQDNLAQEQNGCVTAVAISPGLDYYGLSPIEPAFSEGLMNKQVMVITSERDTYPAQAAKALEPAYPDQINTLWLEGNAHGIDLLEPAVINRIITWLNFHMLEFELE